LVDPNDQWLIEVEIHEKSSFLKISFFSFFSFPLFLSLQFSTLRKMILIGCPIKIREKKVPLVVLSEMGLDVIRQNNSQKRDD